MSEAGTRSYIPPSEVEKLKLRIAELERRMEYMYANTKAKQDDMSSAVIASWFDACGKALEEDNA